ncbi:uncharacterized protein K460DRAFT_312167 [Cucurbitaria berberidis CBS 394.84]|uniref:Aminoglycoside phosphotransferase domain-containing protein n=1 Tax=Cucurbitaria berberidis CBS 394.84 TaxID=1168544 RepID=A0A9P4GI50_9PLEO|nr:uncharacterized protein K460DRAFT_312167 [Cucurbitaria berberidis CBS 394.84]KAF1845606.1 hypothetical protein K460DRAFT_312167 [Cucurbitaria berberidis CBS 394.84]
MRSKAEVFQEHFNVRTYEEASNIYQANSDSGPRLPLSSCTKLTLPYEASSHPGIPSFEEIAIGMKNNKISERFGYRDENCKVRVPKLYALFSRGGDIHPPYYMVMEFIEGELMNYKKWVSLSSEQREKVHCKISEQLQLLRSVPSEGYYGRVKTQGFYPQITFVQTDGEQIRGPYRSYEDLLSAMHAAAEIQGGITISSENDPEVYTPEQKLHLSEFKFRLGKCSGHEPKLTHVDPGMQNWVVRPLDGSMQSASDYEVTFIDWGGLGWFPAWVQMASFDTAIRGTFYDKTTGFDENEENRFLARVAQGLEESYAEAREFYGKVFESCSYGIY